jgi:Na+-transporting methylmalonyl-CoA/oxaloacetate decarboxylase gamma subunit
MDPIDKQRRAKNLALLGVLVVLAVLLFVVTIVRLGSHP